MLNNSQPPAQGGKNFRALDNDDKLKSTHARSGFPPRALITKHSLKVCVVLGDACSEFTSYSKSVKLPTSSDRGVRNPLLPFGLSSPVPIKVHSSHLAGLPVHLYKIIYLALT